MSGEEHDVPRDDAPGEQYLWDPTAPPDPVIQRLEHTLGGLRLTTARLADLRVARRSGRLARSGALAAAVLALAGGIVWYVGRAEPPSWEVIALAGTPTVGSTAVTGDSRLPKGRWLETDPSSRASLDIAGIGTVTVEPGSRVRLVDSREGKEHRMELAKGTIQAFITAPPRLFFVDTPSAQAIDMGCIYRLEVLADGSSELKTTFGLVELVRRVGSRSVLSKVPTGAVCRTDPARGPGTPRFEDAPADLVAALDQFDGAPTGDPGAPGPIARVVKAARARDTLSLWHLLSRTQGAERATVLETMVALAGEPTGVPDSRTSALEPEALGAWWSHLHAQW